MWEFDDLSFSPEEFCGEARLFPLPNLVMFPNVMQPLHVFEPRYIEMVEDALADDRLIATCLLLDGWKKDYYGVPPIASVACLGKIVSSQKQEDGTYNILLLGLRRVRVTSEFSTGNLYRRAFVELLMEEDAASEETVKLTVQRQLLEAFQRLLPQLPQESEPLEELFVNQVPLGMLTDIVSYTLDLDVGLKQMLLSENRVLQRARIVLKHVADLTRPLEEATQERNIFPPRFSMN